MPAAGVGVKERLSSRPGHTGRPPHTPRAPADGPRRCSGPCRRRRPVGMDIGAACHASEPVRINPLVQLPLPGVSTEGLGEGGHREDGGRFVTNTTVSRSVCGSGHSRVRMVRFPVFRYATRSSSCAVTPSARTCCRSASPITQSTGYVDPRNAGPAPRTPGRHVVVSIEHEIADEHPVPTVGHGLRRGRLDKRSHLFHRLRSGAETARRTAP